MHEMMALSMCVLGYVRCTWGVHLLFRLGKSLGVDCRFCSNICVILRLGEELGMFFFF
jgi:hypothetical protein